MTEHKRVFTGGPSPSVAVIGAGAAGCLAAYAAASRGADVLLLDRNDRIGRKIYATGNGRCNITNRNMTKDCYYSSSTGPVPDRFRSFRPEDLLRLFEQYGVYFHERNGYVYPRTDQASTIAQALEKMLSSAGVSFSLMTEVTGTEKDPEDAEGRFRISGRTSGYTIRKGKLRIQDTKPFTAWTDRVILAAGGMAAPKYGSRGDGYRFAAGFGHTIIRPEPALVPLISNFPALKYASGVRCHGRVGLYAGEQRLRLEEGELQFSGNRISGIPVLQFSRLAVNRLAGHEGAKGTQRDKDPENRNQGNQKNKVQENRIQGNRARDKNQKINQNRNQNRNQTAGLQDLRLRIDFLPEFTEQQWENEKKRRLSALSETPDCLLGDLFLGLVNNGIGDMILGASGLQAEKKCRKTDPALMERLLESLRSWEIPVDGYGSFEQAQTTAGGVPLSELTENFESRQTPGLYMAGELLDADGICGGYNLTWAMISGYLAGCAAAK